MTEIENKKKKQKEKKTKARNNIQRPKRTR